MMVQLQGPGGPARAYRYRLALRRRARGGRVSPSRAGRVGSGEGGLGSRPLPRGVRRERGGRMSEDCEFVNKFGHINRDGGGED